MNEEDRLATAGPNLVWLFFWIYLLANAAVVGTAIWMEATGLDRQPLGRTLVDPEPHDRPHHDFLEPLP